MQTGTLTASDLRQATRLDASTEWLAAKLASAEAAPSSLEISVSAPRTHSLHPLFLEQTGASMREETVGLHACFCVDSTVDSDKTARDATTGTRDETERTTATETTKRRKG